VLAAASSAIPCPRFHASGQGSPALLPSCRFEKRYPRHAKLVIIERSRQHGYSILTLTSEFIGKSLLAAGVLALPQSPFQKWNPFNINGLAAKIACKP
jgi:hypothetical protein